MERYSISHLITVERLHNDDDEQHDMVIEYKGNFFSFLSIAYTGQVAFKMAFSKWKTEIITHEILTNKKGKLVE